MTMFLVGGGPSDGLSDVHDEFVAAARERGNRIAVALLGSQEEAGNFLAEYAAPITQRFPEAEIVPIWLDDEPDPAQNETVWPDDLEQLAGLVVAGGWTPGYLDALMPRRTAIARLVRGGAPYLGYSAGTMVVAKHALVGGWKFRGRQVTPEEWGEGLEEVELRDGLGLVGTTIDVHTNVLHLDRMVAVLEQGRVHSGIAIDEDTALVVEVHNGRTRLAGSQRIHWLSREQGATTIRHESTEAEKLRHAQFVREEAERRAQAELQAQQPVVQQVDPATPEPEPAEPSPSSTETAEPVDLVEQPQPVPEQEAPDQAAREGH